MLEDVLKYYSTCANDLVPGWKKANKNDLCNQYVQSTSNDLKQGYLSAIICRYWPSLLGYINKCYLNIQPEELYDAFIEAIMYALKKQAWLDETSSVYNDPNGPDKCINIKLKHMIWNCEFSYKRMKRDINNHVTCSTDDEQVHAIGKVSEDLGRLETVDMINDIIRRGDYVSALIIHYVMYGDVFINGHIDDHRLCKRLRNFDELEQEQFKELYEVNDETLQEMLNYLSKMNTRKLYNRIRLFFKKGVSNYAY